MNFSVFQKVWVLDILGPPCCGIRATIRICREMLCLPHAVFFYMHVITELDGDEKLFVL